MNSAINKLKQHWEQNLAQDRQKFYYQPKPSGSRLETDYSYVPHGTSYQRLNLYYPEKTGIGLLPTIIDIHGGGWMYGDCNLNNNYCRYLASQGFAVMAMSYRLFPEVGIKAMVQDVFSSLHWLAKYGRGRGFDLRRVLLTGDSAGGHLAALVMAIQQQPKLQEIYQVKSLDFSFNLVAITCGVVEPKNLKQVSDPWFQEVAETYIQLFDQDQVPYNFSEIIGDGTVKPKVMVIGGGQDRFISQTDFLIGLLQKNHYHFITKLWTKDQGTHLGHVFNVSNWEWPESIETNQAMLKEFKVTYEN